MVELTEQELLRIKETMDMVVDELEACGDEFGAIFNSGALEGLDESREIIDALYNNYLKSQVNNID